MSLMMQIKWWGGAVVRASDCWSQGQQFEPCSAHRAKGERYLKPKQPYGSLSRIYRKLYMRVKWGAAYCSEVSGEWIMDNTSLIVTGLIVDKIESFDSCHWLLKQLE